MELLSETLSGTSGFLTTQHLQQLLEICIGPVGTRYYRQLLQGYPEYETLQFGLLLISFADSQMDVLTAGDLNPSSQKLLDMLCGILSAQGFPAVEDRIFVPAVEFWSTYAELVADIVGSDGVTELDISKLRSYAIEAVQFACQRIVFPPTEVISDWDSAERESFIDARKDVADFLQSIYAISGNKLVQMFGELVVTTTISQQWMELEAAAFCLGALSDCTASESSYDKILRLVFSPAFFSVLAPRNQDVPSRTRQSCISLIEKFAEFFERDLPSLPNALNLLFSALDDPLLVGPASKSIHKLCSSCRIMLVPEVGTFLTEYRRIVYDSQVDCLANERITGAIGSVIQACEDVIARHATIHQLLDILSEDLKRCLMATNNLSILETDAIFSRCGRRCLADVPQNEIPLHICLRVLRCLASLGKGMQAPVELAVDVDREDVSPVSELEALASVHSRIIGMIVELQNTFPYSGEVVEAICSIFKTGFSETSPGPFVFSSNEITSYLTRQPFSTPRIGVLVSTACSFASSMTPNTSDWPDAMGRALNWVTSLVQALPSM